MCIDIARDAVKMMDKGKSLASMRREIDSKYGQVSGKASRSETGSGASSAEKRQRL